jgi:hypothetical protein
VKIARTVRWGVVGKVPQKNCGNSLAAYPTLWMATVISKIPPISRTEDCSAGSSRNSDVGAAALTLDVFLYREVCGNNIIWGFQHVAGFRRRHVGASIHAAWTDSLESVRTALDASLADDRAMLLRATAQELGPRARRCSIRSPRDWSCRGIRPPTPTDWRSSSRRIPGPSGAMCKD